MEPWRAKDAHNGGVDSHHFDEEQHPDTDPHKSKKSDSDRIQVKTWILIRITEMLIRNPGF
jgi:hypothetical protein